MEEGTDVNVQRNPAAVTSRKSIAGPTLRNRLLHLKPSSLSVAPAAICHPSEGTFFCYTNDRQPKEI